MQILAITPDGGVTALEPTTFNLEVDLQDLLRDYPRVLLAANDEYSDRRIWTIGYEVGTSAGTIDLLMLDSTGEVWVVETKLRKNPQVNKHVVGQVLAYASCAAEWTEADLVAIADRYLVSSVHDVLAKDVGAERAEVILGAAARKLSDGDLTCVVVVDELPTVLQRVVEFVNDHATFTLLAMQIGVVEHDGTRFVIPTVTGATVTRTTAAGGGRGTLSYEELYDSTTDQFKALVARLDAWATANRYRSDQMAKSRSRKYVTADGQFILRIYPAVPGKDEREPIELWVDVLHKAGMSAEVERLRQRLRDLTGEEHPSNQQWQFPITVAVDRWDDFVAFIDDYLATKARAREGPASSAGQQEQEGAGYGEG